MKTQLSQAPKVKECLSLAQKRTLLEKEKKQKTPAMMLKRKFKKTLLKVINYLEEKTAEAPSKIKKPQTNLKKKAVAAFIGTSVLAGSVASVAKQQEHTALNDVEVKAAISEKYVDFHKASTKLKHETSKALTQALSYGPHDNKDFEIIYATLSRHFSKENMLQYAYDRVDALHPATGSQEQRNRNIILKKTYKGYVDTLEHLYGEPFLYLLSTVKAESNFDDISSKYFDKKTGTWKKLATGYYQIIEQFTKFSKEDLNDPKKSNLAGYDYMLSLLSEFTVALVEKKAENAPYLQGNTRSEYIMALMNKMSEFPERMTEKERQDVLLYLSAGSNMGITNLLKDKDSLPEETRTHIKKYQRMMHALKDLGEHHRLERQERREIYGERAEENIENLR